MAGAARSGAVSSSARISRPAIVLGALVALGALIIGALVGSALSGDRSEPVTTNDGELLRLDLSAPEGTSYYLYGGGPGPVALSPDGTHVAFTAAARGEARALWVRELNAPGARRVPGTENADYPFWSPDGAHLGFFANGSLRRIALSGGPAKILAAAEAGKGGAWSPSGSIVFTPSSYDAIHVVGESGGEVRILTDLAAAPASESHRLPSFLPDGERFLFMARKADGGASGTPHAVLVGALDGRAPRVVMHSASHAQYVDGQLVYAYQDSLLARRFDPATLELAGEPVTLDDGVATISGAGLALFSVARDRLAFHPGPLHETMTLVRADLAGVELETISTPGVSLQMTVHPESGRIAAFLVDRRNGRHSVWLYDQEVGSWNQLVTDGESRWPIWLPAGDELVFSDVRGVHRVSPSGAVEPTLVVAGEGCVPSDITRDGKLLFDRETTNRGKDIFVSPLDGSGEPEPLVEGKGDDYDALVSPSGDWVGYTSTDQGTPQVFVQPFPGKTRRLHVANHGTFAGWHPDGDRLYFVDARLRLMEVEITLDASSLSLGAKRAILDASPEHDRARCFAFQRDSLMYLKRAPFGRGAQVVRIVLGWRELLGEK